MSVAPTEFGAVTTALILCRWGAQLWLDKINGEHVLQHADEVPAAFRNVVDEPTYKKSVAYTLARKRLHSFEATFDALVLLVVLFSGILPWSFRWSASHWGTGPWPAAGWLFSIGVAFSCVGLPLEWYHQFRLEQRFGFNTSSQKVWWTDRLKTLAISAVLGIPLLWLILKLVHWMGSWWWFWAWATLMLFQLVVAVLAPVLILPLFNKFTPLPEGSLRERLWNLARRAAFRAKGIQVMDGSKRSRHSNAFFTGFGGFRKIVLFDTLVSQLSEVELEAVLAHEIGHFKKKHIPKTLVLSAAASLGCFYLISILPNQPWFYRAFGFDTQNLAPALLLFGLLGGVVGFWLSPIGNWWSRRHEYEADAYAARLMKEPDSLIGALRKLNEKNLSNLTPHPVYSAFYYSHPALIERERGLRKASQAAA